MLETKIRWRDASKEKPTINEGHWTLSFGKHLARYDWDFDVWLDENGMPELNITHFALPKDITTEQT